MRSSIPVVTVDYVHYNCTAVSSNNIKGMEELLHYVYKNGHRAIAYIHGQRNSYVTRERLATYYRVMEELHLEVSEEYVTQAAYLDPKLAAEKTKELLHLKVRPTCILYPDDTSLIGGRNVIIESGLKIPDDISIVGYDGIKVFQLLHPQITTIGQATDQIGQEAAKRLIYAIENTKISLVERVVIEGTLYEGKSVKKINRFV